jgi:hypothetical protein
LRHPAANGKLFKIGLRHNLFIRHSKKISLCCGGISLYQELACNGVSVSLNLQPKWFLCEHLPAKPVSMFHYVSISQLGVLYPWNEWSAT